jgi:beta-glucanase (GH16 family)
VPLRRVALLLIAAALCGLVAPVAWAKTGKGKGRSAQAAAWTWSTRVAGSGRYDVAIRLKQHAGHKPGQDVLQVTGPDGKAHALDAAVLPKHTARFTLVVPSRKLTLRFVVRKGKPAVATTRVATAQDAPTATIAPPAPAATTPPAAPTSPAATTSPAPVVPATPPTSTTTATPAPTPAITVTPAPTTRKLLFDDEFDGAAGALPADSAWDPQTGAGWGSGQLQNYTDRTENVKLDGAGHLAVVARKESYQGSTYTSARLQTKGRFSFTYGRAEARIKVPAGAGIWPAFWLLGDDIYTKGWPEAGEIDVMETIGSLPDELNGTVHAPLGAWNGDANADGTEWTIGDIYKNPTSLADAFHVYAVEWTPGSIAFEIDGKTYQTVSKADMPAGGRWTFDHPNHLLLNLAVGGEWPGPPNASTPSVSTMLVDYVRVYAPRG